jgi:hypothetical protein
MDLKLNSKKSTGIIVTFILVILLTQSKIFNFIFDTYLGRIVLLAFIILIAYLNKYSGLIAVLFIVILFNHNTASRVHSYNYFEGFKNNETKVIQDKSIPELTANPTPKEVKSREGFNMIDRETNILRGKQSNTVPVFNHSKEQSEDVSPSDKSVFTNDFASF